MPATQVWAWGDGGDWIQGPKLEIAADLSCERAEERQAGVSEAFEGMQKSVEGHFDLFGHVFSHRRADRGPQDVPAADFQVDRLQELASFLVRQAIIHGMFELVVGQHRAGSQESRTTRLRARHDNQIDLSDPVIGAQMGPPVGDRKKLQLGINNSRVALPYASPSPYALSI